MLLHPRAYRLGNGGFRKKRWKSNLIKGQTLPRRQLGSGSVSASEKLESLIRVSREDICLCFLVALRIA